MRNYVVRWFMFCVLCSLLLVGCKNQKRDEAPGISAEPLSYQAGGQMFSRLSAEETGIEFQNLLQRKNMVKYMYNGAGMAAGDYNGDGLVDIYLVSEEGENKLYRNLGGMKFTDATPRSGLVDKAFKENGFSIGAHFADIDNDGDLDLFVTNWVVSNQLFRNNGDGSFTDITEQAGVVYAGGSTTSSFADYDRDGDLDFFVATYRPLAVEIDPNAGEIKVELNPATGRYELPVRLQDRLEILYNGNDISSIRELGEKDLLYRNNGDGTFTEVAESLGITGKFWGLSAIFSDMNQDGWPDLYVTNDFWSPDGVYYNDGGRFVAVPPEKLHHTPMYSMGIDFADINNDGLPDFFIGEMISRDHYTGMMHHVPMGDGMMSAPETHAPQMMRNGLFVSNGDGSFTDIAFSSGVVASEWTWTVKFDDIDLDGFEDLLITNGMAYDLMNSDMLVEGERILAEEGEAAHQAYLVNYPPLKDRDLVFKNNGDGSFADVSQEWGFNTAEIGHGASVSDFDGDGDLDVMVNYLNAPVGIFRNDASNKRVVIKLEGQSSNSFGLGAVIKIETNSGVQVQEMSSSGGYLSGHAPTAVFGLGSETLIRSITVNWPSGERQQFTSLGNEPLKADMVYTIVESTEGGVITPSVLSPQTPVQFKEVSAAVGLDFVHQDGMYHGDFEAQPLLPRGLANLGPGVVWADMDGDGDDDIYIAGGENQMGAVYRNDGNGRFAIVVQPNMVGTVEEQAALWWAVAPNVSALATTISQITENEPGTGLAQYLNSNGTIQLQNLNWKINYEGSLGALAANDIDGDGDLDLFVGGRVRPGAWPLATDSVLFVNNGGGLEDVTATRAPGLQKLGVVSSASWADMDGDGDSDLLVATEWGAVHLLQNNNGRLEDITADVGLSEWTGWWNGLAVADFDGDGDLDFAASNWGTNHYYDASPEHPTVLYAGNIGGMGKVDLVEGYYIGDQLFPRKHRGMAGESMSFVLDKYPNADSFAKATFMEIYGDHLGGATRFEANRLEHTVFLNENGRFVAHSLPAQAQIFPAFGIVAADFDNDGMEDLYLSGNFSYGDHDMMAYNNGPSYWLRGTGDGQFTVVPTNESGLYLPSDGRGVAVSDYNQDGWVDILVGVNNGKVNLFENQGMNENQSITVRLVGPAGNPTGIGAQIEIRLADGKSSKREIQAGSSYWSQNSAVQLFGLGMEKEATVVVYWRGQKIEQRVTAGEKVIISLP